MFADWSFWLLPMERPPNDVTKRVGGCEVEAEAEAGWLLAGYIWIHLKAALDRRGAGGARPDEPATDWTERGPGTPRDVGDWGGNRGSKAFWGPFGASGGCCSQGLRASAAGRPGLLLGAQALANTETLRETRWTHELTTLGVRHGGDAIMLRWIADAQIEADEDEMDARHVRL
ncbi:hypothetical protein G7046_g9619 [Stylonectria norvegica]|nr:hypothetical protein G7046_g9619 [Stylonectria norvegica]